jgi:hypothetical protein
MNLIAAFALGLLFAVNAGRPEPEKAGTESIRAALTKAIADHRLNPGSAASSEATSNWPSFIMELQFAEQRSEMQAEQVVARIAATVPVPAVQKACEAYLKRVRGMRAVREQQFAKDADAALESAGREVLAAKTARDLDETLRKLAPFRQSDAGDYGPSPAERRATQRVQNAIQAVQRWQDHLMALETGDTNTARNVLSNLPEDNGLNIPRSQILERSAKLKETPAAKPTPVKDTIDPFTKRIRTLDDIAPVLAEIDSSSQNRSSRDNRTISALTTIARQYGAVKNGFPVSIPFSSMNEIIDPVVSEMQRQLIALLLPRVLGVEEKEGPKQGETIDAFLTRMIRTATEREDWQVLQKALAARRSVEQLGSLGGGANRLVEETNSLQRFLAGMNQERAGQFSLAVATYNSALRMASGVVPPEVIGRRLEAIKTAHPKDFEEGLQRFLTQPELGNSGIPASRFFGPRGYPGAAPPPDFGSSSLTVPAASPAPSPSASPASASSATPPAATPSPASPAATSESKRK